MCTHNKPQDSLPTYQPCQWSTHSHSRHHVPEGSSSLCLGERLEVCVCATASACNGLTCYGFHGSRPSSLLLTLTLTATIISGVHRCTLDVIILIQFLLPPSQVNWERDMERERKKEEEKEGGTGLTPTSEDQQNIRFTLTSVSVHGFNDLEQFPRTDCRGEPATPPSPELQGHYYRREGLLLLLLIHCSMLHTTHLSHWVGGKPQDWGGR